MSPAATCPDLGDLQRFVLGQSPDAEAEQLESHLAQCPACVEALATLHGQDTLVDAVRGQAKAVAEPDHATVVQLMERLQELRPQVAGSADMPTEAPSEGGQPPKENVRADGASDAQGSQAATLAPSSTPSASIPDSAHERYDFLAPPEAADEIGRLGHYRILKVLGTGGMGVVFEARDPHLDRLVALKTMLPALAANSAARQRFEREAKAAAAIKHDHIVTIHQVGEDRGVPFLAMEFLEGESLDDRLKRESKLPVPEVLRIGREIAEGLAAAHERGLIHRDIKPANIWLEAHRPLAVSRSLVTSGRETASGRVKILDFGLARAAGDTASLTQLGTILGTPAFMAPEQSRNLGVDHRSDLFSLGCVLYRICTGELPFKGSDTMSIVAALALDDPPPPQKLNPEVPPELSELVMRLLAKKPDERPASAGAVALALEAISAKAGDWRIKQGRPADSVRRHWDDEDGTGQFVPAPSRRKRSRWPLAAAVAALCVVGASLLLFAPTIIRIVTNQGQLVIETDDPNVEVKVSKGGQEVTILDLKTQKEINLKAGTYQLELTRGKDGLSLSAKEFTLTRGGRKIVQVRWEAALAGKLPAEGPQDFTNTLGMKFKLIPAGKFTMGSSKEEIDYWLKQNIEGWIKQPCPPRARSMKSRSRSRSTWAPRK